MNIKDFSTGNDIYSVNIETYASSITGYIDSLVITPITSRYGVRQDSTIPRSVSSMVAVKLNAGGTLQPSIYSSDVNTLDTVALSIVKR